ncbi:putative glycolipid-binding domain-containing protein [Nocardia sp. NPDC001965]
MSFTELPATAAWAHRDARAGFEVVYPRRDGVGHRMIGCTTAVEDGRTWFVEYDITIDSRWVTRSARVTGRSVSGRRSVLLQTDGVGHWRVDGAAAAHLDGCLDVDLESSALTNTLPVHRLALPIGARADAPAAYVRANDLTVERLEQRYRRIDDSGTDDPVHSYYDYVAPAFDFACRLVYDESGLVLHYPGIATRIA